MTAGLPDTLGPSVAEAEPDRSLERGGGPGHARVELRAQLRGVGLWTPAFPEFGDWVGAGMPERWAIPDKAPRPPAELLHPRLRRRTSTLTRAAITAIEAAIGQAGVGLDSVRFVLVSSFGEIETTVALLEQLAEPGGPVSPTKFHNSVHNTATGYISIASGNQCEATALAGGPHSLEIGLLEVLAGFAADAAEGREARDAVLIFAEELLPAPFERDEAESTFAVALHLCAQRPSPARGRGLDVELRMREAPSPAAPTALAPGVGGVGLPAMVPALFELLRGVAGSWDRDGDRSGERDAARDVDAAPREDGGRAYALAGGHDPSVASAWTLSLHPKHP